MVWSGVGGINVALDGVLQLSRAAVREPADLLFPSELQFDPG
jgi:hypothetical protein